MAGWMSRILSGIDDYTPDFITDPLLDTARAGWDIIDEPLGAVFQVADMPRQFVAGGIGHLGYGATRLGIALGTNDPNDPTIRDRLRAYEEGGGRGFWEEYIDDQPWYARAAADIVMDPLTYVGGIAAKSGRALDLMKAAGDTGAGYRALQGVNKTASVMHAPDKYIFDPAVAKVVGFGMDHGGRKLATKVGDTRFAQNAIAKAKHLMQYGDHVAARFKADQAEELTKNMLHRIQGAESGRGFINAQTTVPSLRGRSEEAAMFRNQVNPDPSLYRQNDRLIRQANAMPVLGQSLEDRTTRLWGERNPKVRQRLIQQATGASRLDTRVPRSDRGLDTADLEPGRITAGVRPDGDIEPFANVDTEAVKKISKIKWGINSKKTAKNVNEFMTNPENFGGSYRMTSSGELELMPDDPTARFGYPVALTSAGDTGVLVPGPDAEKAIEKAMKDFRPLLEDPDIFIGAYRMDNSPNGEFSFDINIMARTPEEADIIASVANQESWFDPISMEGIKSTGGTMDSNSPFKDVGSAIEFKGLIDESRASGIPLSEVLADAGIEPQAVPPLPARAIREELGFNTAEEQRKMRTRRSQEKLAETREASGSEIRTTLSTMDDASWATMADKASDEVEKLVTTIDVGVERPFTLDAASGVVEVGQPAGFPVTISKTAPITVGSKDDIVDVLENYRRVIQDPDIYLAVEKVGPSSYTINFNVDALTRDEAQAIGALTGQRSFFDPEAGPTGANVDIYHGTLSGDSPFKTVSDIEDLKNAIDESRLGNGTIFDNLSNDYAGVKIDGAFAPELEGPKLNAPDAPEPRDFDSINFRKDGETKGQFTNRSVRELMENARGVGLRNAIDDYKAGMRRTMSNAEAAASPDYFLDHKVEPLSDPDKRWLPYMSDEENDRLFGVLMEDGASVGEHAIHTFDQLERDKMLFEKAGVHWGPEDGARAATDVYKRFESTIDARLTDDEKKLLKARLKNWDKLGINPTADNIDNAGVVMRNRIMKESGAVEPARGKMGRMISIWSSITLTSPRYILGNLSTNIMDAFITDTKRFTGYRDFWRVARAEYQKVDVNDFVEGSKMQEYFADWGIRSDQAIHNRTTRKLVGARTEGKSELRRMLESWHPKMGALAAPVDATQAMAQAGDVAARSSMAMHIFDEVREQEMPELLGRIHKILDSEGIDLLGRDPLPNMDPAYIYNYYRGMGLSDGYATRISRDVANIGNKAKKKSNEMIEKTFFSYRRTRADDFVAKFVPFHYWASRKLVWYAEEMYRNPVLLANYGRAIEGLDRAAEDPGLSARQKGFLSLFSGPTGFTLLMNPDALLGVVKASTLNNSFSGYETDGETFLGGIVKTLQDYGIGLYPWLDGALNMIGMYGDTFEPDMLGIRHRSIVGATINYLRGEGFFGEGNQQPFGAPYGELNLQAREKVSGWASLFLPDWASQKVVARDKTITEASIETSVESRIIAENPDLTNRELLAIMNDPESPEYRSAYQDVARAGILGQLLSFTAPVTFKARENTRDVRTASNQMRWAKAEELGLDGPWQIKETDADAEFRAEYKKKTGREFSIEDAEKLDFERQMTNAASPEARDFIVFDREYNSIAQGRQKKIMDEYYRMVHGDDPRTRYMPDDQRREFANSWAERTGVMSDLKYVWDLQQAYRETHPIYAQYHDWRQQMNKLKALSGGTLSEYRRMVMQQNPSAAQFFMSEQRRLEGSGIAPEDMGAEMDRITVSANAWFAINGMEKTKHDPRRDGHAAGMGDPLFNGQAAMNQYQQWGQPKTGPNAENVGYWEQELSKRGF